MGKNDCYSLRRIAKPPTAPQAGNCVSSQSSGMIVDAAFSLSENLSTSALRRRIAQVGSTDEEVYAYVVRSVRPVNGEYEQRGSAPNFQGGLITLCTCKHSMRATLTSEQWQRGVWVAGLTSWDQAFEKQQSLVYLMRVGEAFNSQAELVQELRESGRSQVIDAKASTRHPLGDLMIPGTDRMSDSDKHSPAAYLPPMLKHAHRRTADDCGWENDVNYIGAGGRQSVMLVGDPQYSFIWTKPVVRRRAPAATRPYRRWTMTSLLDELEAVK
jgi:hypothetical protein